MATYRFTAFDNAGQEHEGTLSASSSEEAVRQLKARGLRIRMLQESQYMAPQAPQAPAQQPSIQPQPRPNQAKPKPTARAQVGPSSAPQQAGQPAAHAPQGKQVVNMPSKPQPTVFRTAAGSDKELTFLFSQIASGLRAGINPAQFFNEVAPRTKGKYRDSLSRLASSAAEGIPMSTIMAQYPDLYPPHVVGGVRAGEQGGFLPDACQMIADQAERAYRFKRFFWWISVVVLQAIVAVPAMLAFRVAFLSTWDATEARGGGTSQGVLHDMARLAWQAIVWPYGPMFLFLMAIFILVWILGQRSSTRAFRHGLAARWPVFGTRARHESLAVFSWTMSKLAAAGLPQQTAWDLAAASVPNMTVQQRIEKIGRQVTREGKMSDAIHQSNLFPQEYAPMVATAEYTGDLPRTMEQLSKVSQGEYEASENYAKLRGGCWGCLATVVTGAFIIGVTMYMYYTELPARILKDTESP